MEIVRSVESMVEWREEWGEEQLQVSGKKGAELPKSKKSQNKFNSAISYEESPSKKKPTKTKKDVPTTKPKLSKKKAPVKDTRGKGLNVLSKVALSKVAQLKEATKQSMKDFYISQVSAFGIDEGTSSKLGVPDVPKYDSKSDKEYWGNSDEEDDDDEDDTEDDGDDDDNDDESDDEMTESDRDEIPDPNQTNDEHAEEEKEYNDERVHTPEDHELTDE
nr:hypothetical protein [Tanacetum cinerariifolium]